MTTRDPMKLLLQCCDMLCDDLEGQPLDVPRPGKGDMVLVSSATYSRLLDRIATLEAELMTDDQLDAEHDEMIRMLSGQSDDDRTH